MKKKNLVFITTVVLVISLAVFAGCRSKTPTAFQLGHLNSTAHLLGFEIQTILSIDRLKCI